jgi:EAL domain-containing protein (putative c-di-GMP-specific phosphodiesterase class I)
MVPVPPTSADLPANPVSAGEAPISERGSEEEVARLLRRPESLRCVYQPVVDLRSGEQAGYEALTRVADWPARSPQPWFAAAARTGLAGQLEAASLQNALRGRAELGSEQFLAVNVAAAFLDDAAVISVLREQKDLTGIVVELGWPDGATGAGADPGPSGPMAAMRVEGLRIACDVVEAGRAELERLERIRPDLVKLDASLVKGAYADPVRDRLIRLVVSMASAMGAVVQAEGIESLDDARHMQVVGARLAQGWLFGRSGCAPPSPPRSSAARSPPRVSRA